jgi:ankyrin repeat protein
MSEELPKNVGVYLRAEQSFRRSIGEIIRAEGEAYESSPLRKLFNACRVGDVALLEQAICRDGASVNDRGPHCGRAALHHACAHGQEKAARCLLKHGASPHQVTLLGRETPLHLAAASGSRAIVFELLQRHGADPNVVDKSKITPLHCAASVSVAKLLLKAGASAISKDHQGQTAWKASLERQPQDKDLCKLLELAWIEHQGAAFQAQVQESHRVKACIQAVKDEELRIQRQMEQEAILQRERRRFDRWKQRRAQQERNGVVLLQQLGLPAGG